MLKPICDLCGEPIEDIHGIVVHKPEGDNDCHLSMTIESDEKDVEATVDIRARHGMHVCPECLINAVKNL